jgi:NAD(P)-dependent dehydrogenase (short-subunit alcohol dehydrogenase family)
MKTAKTVLITGASTGFGRDTAETLGRVGHSVYASMRDITSRNRAHAEAVRALGINVVELDVTDDASVESTIDAVLAEAGRLDALVNNAGIASVASPKRLRPNRCAPCSRSTCSGCNVSSAPCCRHSVAKATVS